MWALMTISPPKKYRGLLDIWNENEVSSLKIGRRGMPNVF